MSDPASKLGALFGSDEVVANLTDKEAADLLLMFEQASADQRVELDTALDKTLGHLPFLVRGAARKILFGRDSR